MNKCESWSSYKQSSKTLESGYATWCMNAIQVIILPVPTSEPAPFPQEHPNHLSLLPRPRTCPSVTPERGCEEADGFNWSRLRRWGAGYRPGSITGLADASQSVAWWIGPKHTITHSWARAHLEQRSGAGRRMESKRKTRGEEKSGQQDERTANICNATRE